MKALFERNGPWASWGPGSMSTNFSPNSVFGRIVALASTGTFSPLCSAMVTCARPFTRWTLVTCPTLMPWILTSDRDCSPWPAEVKLAWRRYFGDSLPEPT